MSLREKRERQARRLLKVCLPHFTTSCLRQYLHADRKGELRHGDPTHCVLGTMAAAEPDRYGDTRGSLGRYSTFKGFHDRQAKAVERVFEGEQVLSHYRPHLSDPANRRMMIRGFDVLSDERRREIIADEVRRVLAARGELEFDPNRAIAPPEPDAKPVPAGGTR